MANPLQHEQHPDADQLNAFMEKALPEHERMATLAHLADCAECREIVFLTQKDLLPEMQDAAKQGALPWWKAWWRPALVAGAAFACLVLLLIPVARRIFEQQNKPIDHARNETANLPSSSLESPPREAAAEPQTVEPPEVDTLRRSRPEPTPLYARQLKRAAPQPSVSHTVQGGVMGGILGGIGPGLKPAPLVASAPGPLTMRKPEVAATAQSAASGNPAPAIAGAAADSAAQRINSHAFAGPMPSSGPLRLTIEHGRGADDGHSTLRGTVRDPTGAVIANATISLHGLSGQPDASATSNAEGEFTLASLPAGEYEIEIASTGFQLLRQRLNLQARDLAQINPVLPLGSATQTVTITSASPALLTESAEVAAVTRKSRESTFVGQAELNGTSLGFDKAGRLYRKSSGDENWKKVRPKWHGGVLDLSTNAEPSFLITTGSGDSKETWTSPDGRHWTRR